ncbi:glycosyltransferase family 39 protein [Babjeviella inositovora NRRL Y-12698]|uniref:Dolichyl-phosphate-mannose--protein mannosyltransferase n=1 Tax=Babjeviella inositovora NRRL Y-12698 TaxID=984486 RepID=A0A1E3QZ06_9ASCO|nr:glycosyltransferase family 39 protein [Babjeviella inositovora NRRL Y-12698]ODQ82919.1 glycosyltransferase family 39 protein [Babjeviella inositovora NRRL Y-12698]
MSGLRKRGKASPKPATKNDELKLDKILKPTTASQSAVQYNIALAAVTFIAFVTRFLWLNSPDQVVFDEVHFGKFASYYLERTYYFDLHPPFAKMCIAAVGWLVGYDGAFKFDRIGDSYIANKVPYLALRGWCALQGTLTIPVMFLTMKELGYSIPGCVFATCLVVFDTAHIAETRLILLDATLILSVAVSIYCYVRFYKTRAQAFSRAWWTWLYATGVALSCVISTKYVGVFTFATIGSAVLYDLWMLLDVKTGLSLHQLGRHFAARLFALIIVPFTIYLFWFWVHFTILTKSGPGDAFMSGEFQETLSESPLLRDAKIVNYYDIVTFKNKDTSAFLHSHPERYPLRYEDGRVSTEGQQVTGYLGTDAGNSWEIVPVDGKSGTIRQADIVRLRHVRTNGFLVAHDVASPLMPTNEEFTVVDVETANGARFNDTLFRLDPLDKKNSGKDLKSKAVAFRVLHIATVVAMWTHNDQLLPDWAFNQQEVNGNKKITDPGNIWTIDKIENISEARMFHIPKQIKKLSFFTKWRETQRLMFEHNNKLSSEHPFASSPESWPFAVSGVSFWNDNDTRKQIYFAGNMVGFWLESAFIVVYLGLMAADQLTRRRNIQALSERARFRLYDTMAFLFVGWCAHFLPFFLMNRQKFLHHYLPAHLIAALLAAGVLEFLFTDNAGVDLEPKAKKGKDQEIFYLPYVITVALLVTAVFAFYLWYAPITYGHKTLSIDEAKARSIFGVKLHYTK